MKNISYIIAAALMLLCTQSCIVSNKPNSSFFDNPHYDYKDAKFTTINIPMFIAKPIIKKALREEGESEELINLIKKIANVKVMTIENGKQEMLTDYAKYLTQNKFEEWMTIKKENELVKFQAKQNGETIRKLLVTVQSENALVYVDVSGKFTTDDISRIINYSETKDVKKIVSK